MAQAGLILKIITKGEIQMRKPTHPGEVLREDVLPTINLPKFAIAKALGISRQHFDRVLQEAAPVTAEMAMRLGKFIGNGPDVWLNMQSRYDLWQLAHDTTKAREFKAIPAYAEM